MQSLDIVSLIESNPITKLSNVYNSKFLMKIKENFTEMEQQMFVSSCYCYLNYNQSTDFVIDLDNIYKWVGFQQKVKAKVLLEKHFILDKDYKILLSQPVKQELEEEKKHGGHNKETFMLTVKTFKLFCIKADTKRANEIHEYFIKMEELLYQVVQEESDELKLQLEQANIENTKSNQLLESNKKEFTQKLAREREQFLIREFGTIGAIVYIIKVKSFENEYIIKIGESRKGVLARYNEHKTKYGNDILLLDCFAVKKSKDFEFFLHNHENIRLHKVCDFEGHENERELFRIGKGLTYKSLLHIISTNLKKYNEHSEAEIDKLQMEVDMLRSVLNPQSKPLTNSLVVPENTVVSNSRDNILLQELLKQVQKLEKSNKEILEKLNSNQTKTVTGFSQPLATLGPRLQQIDPETMTLHKVYESIAECIKEYNFTVKRPSIVKAIDDNIIYHNFRWAFVDRNADPNIVANIEQTKQTKIQNLGYIAKINSDKTEILNVYLDRKTASTNNGYKTPASLDAFVKHESITNGHYYILYDNCSQELQNRFSEKYCNSLGPILYKSGVGQYDSNHQLIREFVCKYDCIKQLKMSDKTLTKALDKDVPYNGSIFKSIGQKLQEPQNNRT
jgi:hypothetical protein